MVKKRRVMGIFLSCLLSVTACSGGEDFSIGLSGENAPRVGLYFSPKQSLGDADTMAFGEYEEQSHGERPIESYDRGDFEQSFDDSGEILYNDEDISGSEEYLTPKDLEAYSGNCTAEKHIFADGEALVGYTEDFFESRGYSGTSGTDFWGYKSGDNAQEVCYEWDYVLVFDQKASQYVSIQYDAVTNDLHTLSVALESKEDTIDYMVMVIKELLEVDSVTEEEIEALFVGDGIQTGYCKNCAIDVFLRDDGIYNISMWPSSQPYAYDQQLSKKELSYGEVMEAGKVCNAVGHLDVLGKEQVAMVKAWLKENGYGEMTYKEFSLNMDTTYRQLGGIEYCCTYYEHEYLWEKEDMSITLKTDTYSDQIHEVEIYGFLQEDTEKMMELVTEILGKGDPKTLAQSCLDGYETDGYAFVDFEHLEIYMSGYTNSDLCYMEVSPLD